MHCPSCFCIRRILSIKSLPASVHAGPLTPAGLADFWNPCRQAIFALPVISLMAVETAIDVAEQAVDAVQSRTLRFCFEGHQSPLAPCVVAANVNDQAMTIVGVLDIN